MWLAEIAASGGADLAQTTASWTGAPPSALGVGAGLVGLSIAAVKVMYSAQTKTLDLERERVAKKDVLIAELTEALRRRNESIEERVVPALIAAAEATRVALKANRRDPRD